MDLNLITFIAFIIFVALLILKDRKNVKLEGIVFIRRTERGKAFIDRIANKHKKFWSGFSKIGVVVSIPVIIFVSFFLIFNAFQILSGQVKEGIRLVLPWAVGQASTQPGVLLLPWWVWVIGIASVIIPHELMHGIVCRLRKIRIQSIGWLILAVIPGAFVEPDEAQLKKSKRSTKIMVYAAGGFGNFVFAAIIWFIMFLLISSAYVQAGIYPSAAIIGYPAAQQNLSGAIIGINGIPTPFEKNLSDALMKIPIGSNVTLQTTTASYNITTVQHPLIANKSYLGTAGPYEPYYKVAPQYQSVSGVVEGLRTLLFWIFFLNLGIGLVNLLPIKPLDGGLIFEEIVGKFTTKTKTTVSLVSSFFLVILIFNLIGPIFI